MGKLSDFKDEPTFFNWLQILHTARDQVKRAKSADREHVYGECGLALVGVTAMLEAYLNLHVVKEIAARGISIADLFDNIRGTPERYKYLPRIFGCPKKQLEEYESHPVHNRIKSLFALRNKYVHGNVNKWKPLKLSKKQITKLWDDALDVIVLLEAKGKFRIPEWKHGDFADEANDMRIA